MLRLNMVTPEELRKALTHSVKQQQNTAEDLQKALSLATI